MSMMRKLFRPGAGEVPKRFIAAFVNATTSFRGDAAVWDIAEPTGQGASGVLEGKTLGTNDFFFVTICPATASNSYGRIAGVYEGTTIGDTDTVNNFADDSLVIVQTWGIHTSAHIEDTTVAGGAVLVASTVAGTLVDAASATNDGMIAGVAMGTGTSIGGTYTRGTVTTANNVTAFIRCDG